MHLHFAIYNSILTLYYFSEQPSQVIPDLAVGLTITNNKLHHIVTLFVYIGKHYITLFISWIFMGFHLKNAWSDLRKHHGQSLSHRTQSTELFSRSMHPLIKIIASKLCRSCKLDLIRGGLKGKEGYWTPINNTSSFYNFKNELS